jgi:hypothetical protein
MCKAGEFASLESEHPSLARWSGAAWDLARVGMRFDQGTGATSTRPPWLSSSSPLRQPVTVNKATRCQLFLLSKEDIANRWCLGHISGTAGTWFCMGERLPGFSHCSVKKHRATGGCSLQTKFHSQADCFYINGGSNRGKPTAKKDPFIHWQDVPAYKHNLFKNGLCTTAEWTATYDNLLSELEFEDSTL